MKKFEKCRVCGRWTMPWARFCLSCGADTAPTCENCEKLTREIIAAHHAARLDTARRFRRLCSVFQSEGKTVEDCLLDVTCQLKSLRDILANTRHSRDDAKRQVKELHAELSPVYQQNEELRADNERLRKLSENCDGSGGVQEVPIDFSHYSSKGSTSFTDEDLVELLVANSLMGTRIAVKQLIQPDAVRKAFDAANTAERLTKGEVDYPTIRDSKHRRVPAWVQGRAVCFFNPDKPGDYRICSARHTEADYPPHVLDQCKALLASEGKPWK